VGIIKRKLKKISFAFDKAHIAYTSKDSPACSLMNDAILFKSLEKGKVLSDTQRAVLKGIGHQISDIDKSIEDGKTPSASTVEGSEVDNLNKTDIGIDEIMSKELQEEMVQLRKDLAESKATNALSGYQFDKELTKELTVALAAIGNYDTILKAFDALNAAAEVTLNKAVEDAANSELAAIAKAKGMDLEGNPLKAELSKEVGDTGTDDNPMKDMTREQKISKSLKTKTEA